MSSTEMHPDGATDPNGLVESHLYLVQHVVNQVAGRYPRYVDRGELWSAGAYGLVDASRRYDATTGVPFARYASIRIRGAIIDATRTRDWATRSLRRDMRQVADATERFEEVHGRSPANEELAKQMGIPLSELQERKAAAANARLLRLDDSLPDAGGGESTLGDRVEDTAIDGLPDEALEQRELIGTVRASLDFLPDVQRQVIERHYYQGELLRDIAESLGVTEARVSQIRTEALNAMRAYFKTGFDGVEEVPDNAPGLRRRAQFVASVSEQSTWRTRLDAGTDATLRSAGRQSA